MVEPLQPSQVAMYVFFLSLEDGGNDVTEVILMFEQLLYDVCGVFGWFVWRKLARYEIQRFGLQSSKMEVLWTNLVFDSKNDFEC